jgi:hypothetical protein
VSLTFVATLLGLGLANIALRATWHEVEDGVLWVTGPQGVTAAEVAPERRRAAGVPPRRCVAGHRRRPVQQPSEVLAFVHAQSAGTRLRYSVLRLQSPEVVSLTLAPLPRGTTALYFVLAVVGIFTLLVGAGCGGTGVTATKPRCTFSGLCLAFFGGQSRSRQWSARSTRLVLLLDDVVSLLAAAAAVPAFHTGSFPNARAAGSARRWGARSWPLLYLPAALLGLAQRRRHRALAAGAKYFISVVAALDRFEPLYLSICLAAGW